MPVHVKTLKDQVDAVLLTIRKDEDQAVAALLGKLEPTSGGRSYRVAKILGAARDLTVALLRLIEPGNGPAQDAARDAIHELGPRMLVLVGIAVGAALPYPREGFQNGDLAPVTHFSPRQHGLSARRPNICRPARTGPALVAELAARHPARASSAARPGRRRDL